MFDRLFKFFSSLWLTVVLLTLALVLVFIGTLAQVKLGLYVAQEEYFRSFLVWWQPKGADWRVPFFPGGWLLGTLLLINLIAAHVKRFKFTWKKSGIFLIHAGLIALLLGQFLTELYQVESIMRLPEGGAKNYTEDSRKNELAIIDVSDPASDKVVSIPESLLTKGEEIRHPELPFVIRAKSYFENSEPLGPVQESSEKMQATNGVGATLAFGKLPTTAVMDDENKPAALIEVVSEKDASQWVVSTWLSKSPWVDVLREKMGKMMGNQLEEPQHFAFGGRTYQIELRPIRYYKDYSITLLESTHEKYQGTDIPKNFSSRVRIDNPKAGEQREVLIYMNNPLRYAGETFYQFQMVSEPGMKSSTLQVVRNPAAVTPYVSCTLIGLGMVVQFLMHLVSFGRKQNKKGEPQSNAASSGVKSKTAEGSVV